MGASRQQFEASDLNRLTGSKDVIEDRCVGCKVCTIACPFGTVNYNSDSGKVIKCDLCDGDPACAKACPTGAITYVDADQTGYGKMRAWATRTDAGSAAAG
jgi:carbon-monoxide dehydrogenase iron sulfur subunit